MSLVDTNVLVNALNPSASDHLRARSGTSRLQQEGSLSITRQIMREFLAVITRPQPWGGCVATPLAVAAADDLARTFNVLDDGPMVWTQLMRLGQTHTFGGKQVHDANIVATMLADAETRILTFNGADFRRFAPLIEVIEP